MTTEKTLRKWRKEALEFKEDTKDMIEVEPTTKLCSYILQLTQELLDLHLLRKK